MSISCRGVEEVRLFATRKLEDPVEFRVGLRDELFTQISSGPQKRDDATLEQVGVEFVRTRKRKAATARRYRRLSETSRLRIDRTDNESEDMLKKCIRSLHAEV